MERFRAEIRSERPGVVTRTGQKNIACIVQGWDVGAKVVIERDLEGHDVIHVYAIGGYNSARVPASLMTTFQGPSEASTPCV